MKSLIFAVLALAIDLLSVSEGIVTDGSSSVSENDPKLNEGKQLILNDLKGTYPCCNPLTITEISADDVKHFLKGTEEYNFKSKALCEVQGNRAYIYYSRSRKPQICLKQNKGKEIELDCVSVFVPTSDGKLAFAKDGKPNCKIV